MTAFGKRPRKAWWWQSQCGLLGGGFTVMRVCQLRHGHEGDHEFTDWEP